MEKQRHLNAPGSRPLHVATLPGQNSSDIAGDMGGLDSADGNHLFAPTRAPISAVRTRAFLLGAAFDLYDQSLCRKNRGRCAAGVVRCDRTLNRGLRGFLKSESV